MAYLTKDDFDQAVYADILEAITKGDDDAIDSNISSTIDEMKGYLNGRYDVAAEFAKTGNARNKFLLRVAINHCQYYLYSMHNPRKMTVIVKENWEKAIADLEKIQAGKLNPVGLAPIVADPVDSTSGNGDSVQWGSTEQTETGY